jgi:hypothetical protein
MRRFFLGFGSGGILESMPFWAWVVVVWLVLAGLLGWALSRWFRIMRDGPHD